jgi:hypothetical protein
MPRAKVCGMFGNLQIVSFLDLMIVGYCWKHGSFGRERPTEVLSYWPLTIFSVNSLQDWTLLCHAIPLTTGLHPPRSSYEKSCQAQPQVRIPARTAFHSCIWNEPVTASVILEATHIITYPWCERSQYGTGIRIRLHVLHMVIMMVSVAAIISYHYHCHRVYFDSWLLDFMFCVRVYVYFHLFS